MEQIKQLFIKHKWPLIILFVTWGMFFITLFPRFIREDPTGIYGGHVNVWGDWALHISMVNTFAHKAPSDWFAYHPIFADGQFTYAFLPNMISGLLVRAGFSLPASMVVPSVITALLMLLGMYTLYILTLKSSKRALLAITMYLMSSGLGFIGFFREFFQNPSWGFLAFPIKEYSRIEEYSWLTGNVVVGLIMPQRAFLLGITLGIWALVGLIYILERLNIGHHFKKNEKRILVGAGLAAGLLPIAHAHSFIAIIILSGLICLFNYNHWRRLLYYVVPAGILSSVLYLSFISGGIQSSGFFKWFPGWTMKDGIQEWVTMWLIFWGAMIPMAIAGFLMTYKKESRTVKAFFVGSFTLFILCNLFLFQPIQWDNTKLLWWAYLGFCGLASIFISKLWQGTRLAKVIAVILIGSSTLTGLIELTKLERTDRNRIQVINRDDMILGEAIREGTDPLARILIAPEHHNSLIPVWAARPILLGYPGWAWNFGFVYYPVELDIKTMYKGGETTDQLLRKYQISYVAIGPVERRSLSANERYFAEKFPLAFRNSTFNIYDTRKLLR